MIHDLRKTISLLLLSKTSQAHIGTTNLVTHLNKMGLLALNAGKSVKKNEHPPEKLEPMLDFASPAHL